ncbi:MAG: IS607 family transposase, partial [Oscillospiraceae bacterium]|nr:IS607 family transposase [Oscillospiraceae bacterium]
MDLISIGKFAKMVGVTPTTLRRMQTTGELIPYHVSKGGTRYYSMEQLNYFADNRKSEKKIIGYCRVSAPSQKNKLKKQIENIKLYMCAKGYQFEMIEDIGSATDYTRKGLRELLFKINRHEISKIVISCKDVLVKSGYEMFAYICELNE